MARKRMYSRKRPSKKRYSKKRNSNKRYSKNRYSKKRYSKKGGQRGGMEAPPAQPAAAAERRGTGWGEGGLGQTETWDPEAWRAAEKKKAAAQRARDRSILADRQRAHEEETRRLDYLTDNYLTPYYQAKAQEEADAMATEIATGAASDAWSEGLYRQARAQEEATEIATGAASAVAASAASAATTEQDEM